MKRHVYLQTVVQWASIIKEKIQISVLCLVQSVHHHPSNVACSSWQIAHLTLTNNQSLTVMTTNMSCWWGPIARINFGDYSWSIISIMAVKSAFLRSTHSLHLPTGYKLLIVFDIAELTTFKVKNHIGDVKLGTVHHLYLTQRVSFEMQKLREHLISTPVAVCLYVLSSFYLKLCVRGCMSCLRYLCLFV